MFLFLMALEVHHIMIPDARSTAESTKLDIIDIDEDKNTAMAFATSRHCKKDYRHLSKQQHFFSRPN